MDMMTMGAESGQDNEIAPDLAVRYKLEQVVLADIREALAGRGSSGIEAEWRDAEDLMEGRDALTIDFRQRMNLPGKETSTASNLSDVKAVSRIYFNILGPRTRDITARFRDMVLPTSGKRPWELFQTPIPDIEEAANRESPDMVTIADGSQQPKQAVAAYLIDKHTKDTQREADWIEDQFVNGGPNDRVGGSVYGEMRDVVDRAGMYGTGVLKGPITIMRRTQRWTQVNGMQDITIEFKPSQTSKSIPPENIYPDPNCGDDIHAGRYIVEADYITSRGLRELARDPSYFADAIAECLAEGPRSSDNQFALLSNLGLSSGSQGVVLGRATFLVYYYHGEINREALDIMGVDTSGLREDELELLSVPCCVTMCNDKIIKVNINPLESGAFPYDFFTWQKVKGRPWGKGIPIIGEAAQRTLVASIRRTMESVGASGPQVVKANNVTNSTGQNRIVSRQVWDFRPDAVVDDVRKAFAVFHIPGNQAEFLQITKMAIEMLDHLVGTTQLLQGMTGAAPETMGGMALAVSQATGPLREKAKDFDTDIIIPHLTRYHERAMQVAPEDCKHGDAKVRALGSTVMLGREVIRQFVAQLLPFAGDPQLRISREKLVRRMSEDVGFELSEVQFTDDEWAKYQEEMKQNPPPMDPAIQVAQIRGQAALQTAQVKAKSDEMGAQVAMQKAQIDAGIKQFQAQLERELAIIEAAGNEKVSLEEIRSMLASKIIDVKSAHMLAEAKMAQQANELDYAETHGHGI